MESKFDCSTVTNLLRDLLVHIPLDACMTCDCLQGYLSELESYAKEDVGELIHPFKVTISRMHGSFVCEACRPGEAFSRLIDATQVGE